MVKYSSLDKDWGKLSGRHSFRIKASNDYTHYVGEKFLAEFTMLIYCEVKRVEALQKNDLTYFIGSGRITLE